MKITVFTSNQPRHLSLINDLAAIADQVYAVQECNTVFPGRVDDFFKKSDVMKDYFQKVIAAEKKVFGPIGFSSDNISSLSIKSGDLSFLDESILGEALKSDVYIVFGSSWIRSPLVEFLMEHRAINIHMGISPYYRGNSCNFWALYDGHPDLVGATIHLLSAGLDSGEILFHTLPKPEAVDPFVLGMNSVSSASKGLVQSIQDGSIFEMDGVRQDSSVEIRYTRNRDFTDAIASEYLNRSISPEDVGSMLASAPSRDLVRCKTL